MGDEEPPTDLMLDGEIISFPTHQDDPTNVWFSNPTQAKLKSGKLYSFEVTGLSWGQLEWKTSSSPKASIPTSALLPDYLSKEDTAESIIFSSLYKAALLINGFTLGADEVSYWQSHGADFGYRTGNHVVQNFNFNKIELEHWKRLEAYTTLRNQLPKTETSLLDLFKWACTCKPEDASKLVEKIAAVTLWKEENIKKLITSAHFDLERPDEFRNEINLVKMKKALAVADKIGVDIDQLFEWARPTSKFSTCHRIAEDIRKALHSRYDQEDWEKVVKPLNDQLRENQKEALISYLLVQKDLIEWGVEDAHSLFEFFLIDVQMKACRETSRIKQAISTVQLFIQRCMLGLEDTKDKQGNQIGVSTNILDRDRWEWMQRYRVWEANRKVFLYPYKSDRAFVAR